MTHKALPSERWGHLPLFRLLIFLDTTGIQSFDAAVEIDEEHGSFLRSHHLLFSPPLDPTSSSPNEKTGEPPSSPLAEILHCVSISFRENLRNFLHETAPEVALKKEEGEEQSMGTEMEVLDICRALDIVIDNDAKEEVAKENREDVGESEEVGSSSPSYELKGKTIFEYPSSLTFLEDALDGRLTLVQRLELMNLFCGPPPLPSSSSTSLCETIRTKRSKKRAGKTEKKVEDLGDGTEMIQSPVSRTEERERVLKNRVSELHVLPSAPSDVRSNAVGALTLNEPPRSNIQCSVKGIPCTTGLSIDAPSRFCCHHSPSSCLVEQLIIDGLDRWLRSSLSMSGGCDPPPSSSLQTCSAEQSPSFSSSESFLFSSPLQRMVLACGGVLSPDIVLPLLSTTEGVCWLIEFLLDILFPLPLTPEEVEELCQRGASHTKAKRNAQKKTKGNGSEGRKEEKGVEVEYCVEVGSSTSLSFSSSSSIPLRDWLLLAYHTNREVSDAKNSNATHNSNNRKEWKKGRAEEEDAPTHVLKDDCDDIILVPSSEESDRSSAEQDEKGEVMQVSALSSSDNIKKRRIERSDSTLSKNAKKDSQSLSGWSPPDDGDVYVTSETIDAFMHEHPEKLPRHVVMEKRRKVADPKLTRWELDNHYTAVELRNIIKDLLREQEVSESSPYPSSQNVVQVLSAKDWERVKKFTKKVEFIDFLMGFYTRENRRKNDTSK